MKTLFLVRHAKSSRDPPGLPDEDRPLAGRGERDAPQMGRRLAKRDVEPDLILSSPASRALATAKLFAAKLHYKPKRIVVDRRLYPGRLEELLTMIEELDDELDSVMLFGHNPALLRLAHRLSLTVARLPTCAVAELVFDTRSWRELRKAPLLRMALDYPRKS